MKLNGVDILVDINGKYVILVDDVLFIGWIVWVVLDVLMDYGCFVKILLVVLVDCGYCELLIWFDFIGKNILMVLDE